MSHQPWEVPSGWELADHSMPVVTYRCVEGGRGTKLGAVFADANGRPVFLWWGPATAPHSQDIWLGGHRIDVPGQRMAGLPTDRVPLWCRFHGFWALPCDEMQSHWEEARKSRPTTIKLNHESPWTVDPNV